MNEKVTFLKRKGEYCLGYKSHFKRIQLMYLSTTGRFFGKHELMAGV